MPEPVVLTSSVREVRVYRSGAVVTRWAPLRGEAWPSVVALDGLPLALDDESVRVRVDGPVQAELPAPCDVRVELALPPVGDPLEAQDDRERREANEDIQRFEAQLARIQREHKRLGKISFQLPAPFENRPPRAAPSDAWLKALEWLTGERVTLTEERLGIEEALRLARERLARVERRLAELRARRDAREDAVSKRVVLSLRGGGAPVPCELKVEYKVHGARWTPAYVFRMARDGQSAELSMRALVAQHTGEPWEGVRLAVSTAGLLQETELPELQSLRIGRRQPAPAKRAWREPPTGAEVLFEGLDRANAGRPRPPPQDDSVHLARMIQEELSPPEPAPEPVPAVDECCDEEAMALPAPPPPAPRARAMPAPMAAACAAPPQCAPAAKGRGGFFGPPGAPAPMKRRAVEAEKRASRMMPQESCDEDDGMMNDPFGGAPPAFQEPEELTAGNDQLRYAGKVLAGWEESGRGKLRPLRIRDYLPGIDARAEARLQNRVVQAHGAALSVAHRALPEGTVAVEQSVGSYDYRYDAEGPVDIPGDGQFHSVPLLGRSAPVETTLVVVPRESDKAVRVASLLNPLHAPLLAGKAEIYLEDEYLVTSPIRTVPPGGKLSVGLGVEEALKVARNVHYEEEATGLMGGGLALHHKVEIEIASRLKAATRVEVRERVPIKADKEDKDVEIVVPTPEPDWERFFQTDVMLIEGGRHWTFELQPGESKKLAFTYTVKIDSKNELHGGNRRE